MAEIIDGNTIDIVKENLKKIQEIYPEAFTEGKVDPQKLLLLLGYDVDNSNEKYSFTWKGKNDCIRLAQTPSKGTLLPCKEESVDWDTTKNLYIEGDNLEVLKLLQKSYLGRVKMIYIDPPYNTGNDFVYEDEFADNIANYKKITGQSNKSNAESAGRYHTNWLNMIYPRLKIARTLLSDDGVIFISIDDNEVENLRKICDEIFGENNFVGNVIWQSTQKNDPRFIAINHEYVLCYVKNILLQNDGGKWRTQHPLVKEMIAEYKKITEECLSIDEVQKKWTEIIKKEKYTPLKHYKFVDKRGPYFAADISDPQRTGPKHDFVIHPITGKVCKAPAGGYSPREAEMRRRLENDEIHFGPTHETVVCSKKYLITAEDRLNSVYYEDGRRATKMLEDLIGKGIFEHPKSEMLLSRLLGFVTNKNSIVLDFFSGSATTAHAVMQLNTEDGGNRKFIMVQLPELTDEKSEAYKAGYKNICEIGKERIRRAGAKIQEEQKMWTNTPIIETEEQLNVMKALKDNQSAMIDFLKTQPKQDCSRKIDTGFRVFKLDSSNLVKWNNTPTDDPNEVAKRINESLFYLQADRTDIDFVYEIMLKLGMPLSNNIEISTINDKKVYGIRDGSYSMLICLEYNINYELVEKMAESEYEILIFADRCFGDANMLINTEEILKKSGKTLKLF